MSEFHTGDRVKIIRDTCFHRQPIGNVVHLGDKKDSSSFYIAEYSAIYIRYEDMELIKSTNNLNDMSIEKINPLVAANVDADTQALMQAGYLDAYLMPTPRGRDALTAILYAENKAALVTQANQDIADAKAAK